MENVNSLEGDARAAALNDQTLWLETLRVAVGECIAHERNGFDVLASAAWDHVRELWEQQEHHADGTTTYPPKVVCKNCKRVETNEPDGLCTFCFGEQRRADLK